MRKSTYLLAGFIGAVTAILGIQPPSFATASFSWTFKGDYGVYSRHFYQPHETDIFVMISSWSPCIVSGDRVDVYVYLYKDDTFDNKVGSTKKVTCTGVAKWSMVNPGTYYFRLVVEGAHRDQGTTFTATGRTYYDGSAP